MNITLPNIPDSKYRFIPVASELITGKPDTLTCKGQVFNVIDRFIYPKDEFIPKGFLTLVMGQKVDINDIWKKYSKSDALVIYACIPVVEAKKVIDKPKEKKVPGMFS